MYDVLIIGCGVVGAAAAYALSRYDLRVAVIEKENDVAMGASRANSAIIHAGFDPEEGTLDALLNVRGCAMAEELCRRLDVPYKKNGSLVISFSPEEDAAIDRLYARGVANGVPGLRVVGYDELHEMEPNLTPDARKALYAPSAGIVSPWDYALAMAEVAVRNGTGLFLETEVTGAKKSEEGWIIRTNRGDLEARYVVNCAGVHSGEVHDMACPHTFDIIPCKGQYFLLDKSEGAKFTHTLFQCPSKVGKGVLVSPTVHGNLIVGPDAVNVPDPDDTSTTAQQLAFIKRAAAKTTSAVDYRAQIRNFAGVRANNSAGGFIISFGEKGWLDAAGIKSPGLTAAPAIGEYLAELLEKDGLALNPRAGFVDGRKVVRFKELSSEEKNSLIARDPRYGRVICRCETVTEGEIVASTRTEIPARTVDGVKRRTNAGMGRCQGGFCGPRVVEILARESGVEMKDVLKDKTGSYILSEKL
ncbi:MAG: NAD(P)/FAD-dependent oxidoreductase [Clostridia bacterium]|nr:NAD(P)/FAD-dependent oxidoreductase [Clostridia bacterium]